MKFVDIKLDYIRREEDELNEISCILSENPPSAWVGFFLNSLRQEGGLYTTARIKGPEVLIECPDDEAAINRVREVVTEHIKRANKRYSEQ